jgi:CheY-like chemotaxis protein
MVTWIKIINFACQPGFLKIPERMYKILQIEDMPSDAFLVKREVRKVLGECEFMIVDEKEPFIQALLEFRPHVIISDFSIPGFSWSTALNLARQHSPEVPFLIVTGAITESFRTMCLEAGVNAYINKNEIHELGAELKKLLKL